MDLFHMERYWSDGEEKEEDDHESCSKRLEKLNAKVGQRTQEKEEGKQQQKEEEKEEKGQEEPHDEKTTKPKRKKRKKKSEVNDTGFTVLGTSSTRNSTSKVRRVLPQWLSNPDIILADLSDKKMTVDSVPGLHKCIVDKLMANDIRYLFPVQRQIIPWLLDSSLRNYYRPRDICVSAPTGSGKTLAFVIPVVQALMNRTVPKVRALVILPVQDLAVQVYKVFQTYCKDLDLKVKLLASGQGQSLADEQRDLVRKGVDSYHSLVDILVATPGRLVDHIQKTTGFSLEYLRYLIIDEADRVMEDIQNDWLVQVEAAVYRGSRRRRPGPLTVESANRFGIPLQKLLFSATLSQNPGKLQELNLYEPKLFTSVVKEGEKTNFEFAGKYTTPAELTELYVEVEDPMKKPLILKNLITSKKMNKVLIFTKSADNAHFLSVLLKQFGQEFESAVGELSSQIEQRRKRILSKFKSGTLNYLVCTDALARGIDIGLIDYVISYDCPRFIKTYIHRAGRTARAGRPGTVITLLDVKRESRRFHAMVKEASKIIQQECISIDTEEDDNYALAREKAAAMLLKEKTAKKQNKKSSKKGTKKC